MCLANDDANATAFGSPVTAFTCADHHHGTLCTACDPNYFMRENVCTACDTSGVSGAVLAIVVAVVLAAALVGLLVLLLRKHSERVMRRLVLEREDLLRRRATLTSAIYGRNNEDEDEDKTVGVEVKLEEEAETKKKKATLRKKRSRRRSSASLTAEARHLLPRLNLKLRTCAVDAAHNMVKACETGEFIGETGRIVIGFCQVMLVEALRQHTCCRSNALQRTAWPGFSFSRAVLCGSMTP